MIIIYSILFIAIVFILFQLLSRTFILIYEYIYNKINLHNKEFNNEQRSKISSNSTKS